MKSFLWLCLTLLLCQCSNKSNASHPGGTNYGSQQGLTPDEQALISAVNETGAKSATGKRNALVCGMAQAHAKVMADDEKISHDGFSERSQALLEAGATNTGEIVAMTCGKGANKASAAQTCANLWVKSKPHWKHMEHYWDSFCYTMLQKDGCHYCIGLFAESL